MTTAQFSSEMAKIANARLRALEAVALAAPAGIGAYLYGKGGGETAESSAKGGASAAAFGAVAGLGAAAAIRSGKLSRWRDALSQSKRLGTEMDELANMTVAERPTWIREQLKRTDAERVREYLGRTPIDPADLKARRFRRPRGTTATSARQRSGARMSRWDIPTLDRKAKASFQRADDFGSQIDKIDEEIRGYRVSLTLQKARDRSLKKDLRAAQADFHSVNNKWIKVRDWGDLSPKYDKLEKAIRNVRSAQNRARDAVDSQQGVLDSIHARMNPLQSQKKVLERRRKMAASQGQLLRGRSKGATNYARSEPHNLRALQEKHRDWIGELSRAQERKLADTFFGFKV